MTPNPSRIPQFVTYLRAEKGASENTISNYSLDVQHFEKWLNNKRRQLEKITRSDVQEYAAALLKGGVSARTVRRKLATLRTFFRLLIDDEVLTANPTTGVPIPKVAKALPRTVSESDVNRLIRWAGSRKRGLFAARDKAILLTFYASALRASELISLKLADLDLEGRFIKIWNGKGGKDGMAPLSPPAIDALKHYLRVLRPKLDPDGTSPYVFLSRLHGPLTRQAIYFLIHQAGQTIGKHVSPHLLRHGCASALVKGGADIRDVQAMLRHADINTTQMYVHTDLSYLRRIYEQSHPRA